MKILYLSTDPGIDPSGQGGGSIHIRSFIRALADQNHQLALVSSASADDQATDASLGAAVRLAPLAAWNRLLARGLRQISRLVGRPVRGHADIVRALHNFRFALIAWAAARELKPDFIYERYSLWGMSGLWLAGKLGIPLVLEVNAPLVYEQQQFRVGVTCPPLARWVERHVWQEADLVIAVSESLRSQLQQSGVNHHHIKVLPNGVDPKLFHGDSSGRALRENLKLDGHFTVGFVGTFRPWHGVDLLLKTFQDLHRIDPKTHLLLVGDGPLRSRFEEQVRNAGLEKAVTFAGRIAHHDVPTYLAAMDVTVAPYPALDEFYYSPLKLFEYMAASRAVVASRVGQVAEILVDGETGLLFEPGNSADLLRCLQQVRTDPTLRLELGRKASASCSEHTWNRNAARVIDWVEPLLNRIGSPTSSIREEKTLSNLSRKQHLESSEGGEAQ
jgi:glycosyltransferase involved in cell wall biosynthesis